MGAIWWVSTLAFTCIVVVILIWPAFLDNLAFTLARCAVEILVVWACQILVTLTATALRVKVLTWVTVVRLADTLT